MLLVSLILLAASPSPPATVSPVRCRIAADRMAGFTLLGQGMIENLERRGVPPEREDRYEAMKATLAVDLPLVERALERFKDVKPTTADDAAFGSPNPVQMRELLKAC